MTIGNFPKKYASSNAIDVDVKKRKFQVDSWQDEEAPAMRKNEQNIWKQVNSWNIWVTSLKKRARMVYV